MIFQKNVPSVKISKKINNVQSQLRTIEEQAASKNTQIEAAIAESEVSDKSFAELANIKVKADAVRVVLGKMQSEYNAAQAREQLSEKEAELDRFEKLLEKNLSGLESKIEDFAEAGIDLVKKEGRFDAQYQEFLTIPGPAGINFAMLPRFDIGFITQALTVRPPMNTPARAITTAAAEAKSTLSSIPANDAESNRPGKKRLADRGRSSPACCRAYRS